jgi:ubiquinone/menaquinone biosynthesis C-methylase UbiE
VKSSEEVSHTWHNTPCMRHPPQVAAMVVHCCNVLRPRLSTIREPRGIVVGCGKGDEVVFIRRAMAKHVVGVDIESKFSSEARAEGCIALGDAERLPFPPQAFDFAAAFHSLEHVADPSAALNEIRRVLRPGGWFYLGVPNRSRLVAYLGSFEATPWQKISWNLHDWKARALGKFRNEMGAHAGFERRTLIALLEERFSNVELLTEEFLRFKYAGRIPRFALNLLLSPSLINYSAPSHYAVCRRPETSA